jgi:uncharacterized protein YdhG (YjbR/CyaY superfamily)
VIAFNRHTHALIDRQVCFPRHSSRQTNAEIVAPLFDIQLIFNTASTMTPPFSMYKPHNGLSPYIDMESVNADTPFARVRLGAARCPIRSRFMSNPPSPKRRPQSVKTFDAYLANVAPEQRAALEVLRVQLKSAALGAEECISYGRPALREGRVVCGFGATKKHCALYMFSDTTLDAFADELTGYDLSKGTVRFQPDRPVPSSLVKKLVKARLSECAALDAAKKDKR